MTFFTPTKAIRMDTTTYETLCKTSSLLEAMATELEDIANEDNFFAELSDKCNTAFSAIWDFMWSYKRYRSGE